MSTSLTISSGFMSPDYLRELEDAARDMGAGGGEVYLKFDGNSGLFTYGSSNDELHAGSQVAFNPGSLSRGWICWKDSKVVDEIMAKAINGERPLNKGELPDHGPYEEEDGWQEQTVVVFKMVDAPYHELTFKATGVGKRNAVSRLMSDFIKGYKVNPGLVPIVEVDDTEYESKAKGARGARKHAPVFKIVAWVSEDQLLAGEEGGDPALEDETPELLAAPEPAPAPAPAARPARATPAAPAPAAAPAARQAVARKGRF